MTYPLLSGLMLFCLVSSITPGPNNLMLMAAGANFGVRRALPHAAGVVLGFTFMIIVIGLGAAQFFQKFPLAHTYLTVASVTYLLYLAYKIGTAAPKIDDPNGAGIPITFFQATAFQWVNPKAWTIATMAGTAFFPREENILIAVIFVCLSAFLINLPCISVWALFGASLKKYINNHLLKKIIEYFFSILLVLTGIYLVI